MLGGGYQAQVLRTQMFTVWVGEEGEPPKETEKEQPEEEEEILEN